MSVTCPNGHDSEWPDFCSVCGVSLQPAGAGAGGATPATTPPPDGGTPASAGPAGPTCPNCGYSREATDVFCESCGFDFIAGTLPSAPPLVPATPPDAGGGPAAPSDDPGAAPGGASPPTGEATASWWAVVEADRAYYDREHAGGPVAFPDPAPASVSVPLITDVVRIGRRSASRGLSPEIDLAGPPEDPAVSHRHAELRRQADGSYVVVDVGSTNGTKLDEGTAPLAPDTVHPLADRSRLFVGAFSRITIERR